jgi:hypothetical protein
MVVLGKEIFLEKETSRALVAFLATFYLLDMDYPSNWLDVVPAAANFQG